MNELWHIQALANSDEHTVSKLRIGCFNLRDLTLSILLKSKQTILASSGLALEGYWSGLSK